MADLVHRIYCRVADIPGPEVAPCGVFPDVRVCDIAAADFPGQSPGLLLLVLSDARCLRARGTAGESGHGKNHIAHLAATSRALRPCCLCTPLFGLLHLFQPGYSRAAAVAAGHFREI